MPAPARLIQAARHLAEAVNELQFAPPVTHIYNPLSYAWAGHELYLKRFGRGRRKIIFMGMNPGPFGMVQTGVPFGEVAAVRDWMKITAPIGKPKSEHPQRPILGFDCPRSEISGQRVWSLFAQRFGEPANFFSDHFVLNYCPLAFLEESGRNRTPDKLWPAEQKRLTAVCDAHLREVCEIMQPEWIVGVGAFAAQRARLATAGLNLQVGQILHPSPASPAANRDWAGQVTAQLKALGLWQ